MTAASHSSQTPKFSPKLERAQIAWSTEGVPTSILFDDVYYSKLDGMAEVAYIFLNHNNLPERFDALLPTDRFCIAETGFGAGLNFLKTCLLWLEKAPPGAQLHFISFEKFPLTQTELVKALSAFDELKEISKALLEALPIPLPGWHDVLLFDERVRLTLWFGDALKGLPEFDLKVDAWFLDGFTPRKNPEMWRPELYVQMARLSKETTTFATFTAAGEVRRGLEQHGFEVEKAPGYAKKREMCFGRYAHPRPFSSKAPWFESPKAANPRPKKAVVIGAGLAGAAVAHQLASQGLSVTVLEQETAVAQQASGNLAGAIHPLVTADWNVRSQFYLKGFESGLRWLRPWFDSQSIVGQQNGLMQLTMTDTMHHRLQEALTRVGLPKSFAYWCDANQASELIGQKTDHEGLFFPEAGWVQPASVVIQCLAHDSIELKLKERVVSLQSLTEKNDQAWQILTPCHTYHADVVVVATGALNDALNQQLNLPIRPVKGQVSHFQTADVKGTLKTTVTHRGYSMSGNFGTDSPYAAISGATFEAPDLSSELSQASQSENQRLAHEALPDWLTTSNVTEGKVGFRPTTPDHLPLIGAVPDFEWMKTAYFEQSHTHAVYRYAEQRYQAGLYVSNGHGARGLMSVFLAAEVIGGMVSGADPVLPKSLYHAVHPARFAIRHWRSGKSML
ncbi:bifunctional tRNA (5-methylaminomethyl-2-thiouridine)(34)-methyltransferase MnmD/FAD-dependent 5-carboxymethylaminomethyl-2-thiouridine(34) oxidoreductase MnmC [Hydrogenovibrio sp. 3SP14C1]|uniref:bifunctional tRNA (5-methylaminomethyl-2-thiouridine)(34)-methyltransferase MnmD/FAD-dependent 5-carboxymethylaminomethyl-2-thiouridine(34) oxidoreductase MnmC n=1 Tax=Hydrogenovibrio sp. 3SP14C1 TaxID=3038774 RepID=UPI0024168010|nr:bifunctional tRNA (5-methylaminomethyl-2-thiouridine)(34)-methyltransferase MnmD/FAD-dependent 5-carboxymethylaminomethyl-2-thiouridine(34) oxidoreductase MnmC [Hydrogenovibrio sp. 3SP14C1]MDG4813305.1 bifunctional tRNA (5-methylaminomethyl-2-thiouridine)(34)-methyltransferase MnmD/FAD-dependent 5-carboxymethylaminomethyl-2-thiouridine(34) oxidoreductase MnmC [Hydrogenovibrio sp. 3SP14C1]